MGSLLATSLGNIGGVEEAGSIAFGGGGNLGRFAGSVGAADFGGGGASDLAAGVDGDSPVSPKESLSLGFAALAGAESDLGSAGAGTGGGGGVASVGFGGSVSAEDLALSPSFSLGLASA